MQVFDNIHALNLSSRYKNVFAAETFVVQFGSHGDAVFKNVSKTAIDKSNYIWNSN